MRIESQLTETALPSGRWRSGCICRRLCRCGRTWWRDGRDASRRDGRVAHFGGRARKARTPSHQWAMASCRTNMLPSRVDQFGGHLVGDAFEFAHGDLWSIR